jgi:hypothetical protein
MRYLFILACSCIFLSCSDSFVKHKLKFEKLGDCTEKETPVKMTSNTNGERYEFISCIDDVFDGKNYTVDRKGDSIIVNFPKTTGSKKSNFSLILDIDAKPRYNYISLNGQELNIVPYQ